MTGPEHYVEAERLLGVIDDMKGMAQRLNLSEATLNAGLTHVTSVAQVHATLALAAATADGSFDPNGAPLVRRPIAESPIDPAYPGNEWGQAIHGETKP